MKTLTKEIITELTTELLKFKVRKKLQDTPIIIFSTIDFLIAKSVGTVGTKIILKKVAFEKIGATIEFIEFDAFIRLMDWIITKIFEDETKIKHICYKNQMTMTITDDIPGTGCIIDFGSKNVNDFDNFQDRTEEFYQQMQQIQPQ